METGSAKRHIAVVVSIYNKIGTTLKRDSFEKESSVARPGVWGLAPMKGNGWWSGCRSASPPGAAAAEAVLSAREILLAKHFPAKNA
jgi:hypothetical protein